MSESRYVLYINKAYDGKSQYCAGSTRCLEIIADIPDVEVQHIDQILKSGVTLPQWLEGTPCLVDTHAATATKGSNAIELALRIEDENRIREVEAAEAEAEANAEANAEADDPDEENVFASPAANVDPGSLDTKRVDGAAVQEFMAKRGATMPEEAAPNPSGRPKRKTRAARVQQEQEQALSPPKNDSVKSKKS
jgi:hypothetical protein